MSKSLVATFGTPRANAEEPDTVMFNMPMPITIAGFWYGGNRPVVRPMKSEQAYGHPGAGGSIGWVDPDLNLAVAICHNRMYVPQGVDDDPILKIADAVRLALGIT
jgi:CubicO group peptidase (beta-lactamase class C family)